MLQNWTYAKIVHLPRANAIIFASQSGSFPHTNNICNFYKQNIYFLCDNFHFIVQELSKIFMEKLYDITRIKLFPKRWCRGMCMAMSQELRSNHSFFILALFYLATRRQTIDEYCSLTYFAVIFYCPVWSWHYVKSDNWRGFFSWR